MKIPKSVRIAGVEYEVVLVPNLMNGATAAYGHIDFENSRIELSDSFGTEHQKRCQILWHEILHGIREASGLEIEDEERVVEMFARGIYQVLQDNGARLFDLKENVENLSEIRVDEMNPGCRSALVGALCGGLANVDKLEDFGEVNVAQVVDVLGEARGRFTAWAEEYVGIPPSMLAGETVRGECADEIVRFLVECKVFKKIEIELIAEKRGFFGVIAFDKITEV